jgi:hypothetical protein
MPTATGGSDEPARELVLPLHSGERWWGGAVADGTAMPFGALPHHRDLAANAGHVDDPTAGANQSAPLLLSDHGRYVWSADPFAFTVAPGRLTLRGRGIEFGAGEIPTLAGAFRAAARRHFPPSGRAPDPALFTGPQYNTWMELPYTPTQHGVLDYVRGLLDAGFPPGVVMIDDRWSKDYGVWQFDPEAFPDPAGMITTLHDWGLSGDAVAGAVRQPGQRHPARSGGAWTARPPARRPRRHPDLVERRQRDPGRHPPRRGHLAHR